MDTSPAHGELNPEVRQSETELIKTLHSLLDNNEIIFDGSGKDFDQKYNAEAIKDHLAKKGINTSDLRIEVVNHTVTSQNSSDSFGGASNDPGVIVEVFSNGKSIFSEFYSNGGGWDS